MWKYCSPPTYTRVCISANAWLSLSFCSNTDSLCTGKSLSMLSRRSCSSKFAISKVMNTVGEACWGCCQESLIYAFPQTLIYDSCGLRVKVCVSMPYCTASEIVPLGVLKYFTRNPALMICSFKCWSLISAIPGSANVLRSSGLSVWCVCVRVSATSNLSLFHACTHARAITRTALSTPEPFQHFCVTEIEEGPGAGGRIIQRPMQDLELSDRAVPARGG